MDFISLIYRVKRDDGKIQLISRNYYLPIRFIIRPEFIKIYYTDGDGVEQYDTYDPSEIREVNIS